MILVMYLWLDLCCASGYAAEPTSGVLVQELCRKERGKLAKRWIIRITVHWDETYGPAACRRLGLSLEGRKTELSKTMDKSSL